MIPNRTPHDHAGFLERLSGKDLRPLYNPAANRYHSKQLQIFSSGGPLCGNSPLKKRRRTAAGSLYSQESAAAAPALLQKYIRLKRVKVNGKGSKRTCVWRQATCFNYISTMSFLTSPSEENMFLTVFQPRLEIIYEDENLLLVDNVPAWWSMQTKRRRSIPSSTIFRRTSTRKKVEPQAGARLCPGAVQPH